MRCNMYYTYVDHHNIMSKCEFPLYTAQTKQGHNLRWLKQGSTRFYQHDCRFRDGGSRVRRGSINTTADQNRPKIKIQPGDLVVRPMATKPAHIPTRKAILTAAAEALNNTEGPARVPRAKAGKRPCTMPMISIEYRSFYFWHERRRSSCVEYRDI